MGSTPLSFPTTGISIAFSNVSGSGTVTVTRHSTPPPSTDGISESSVSTYRVVITAADVTVGAGTEVRFATGDFPGIGDPSTVQVYSRASPAGGAFTAVADGQAALLTWRTASETNNSGFHVEQRQPGGAFASLAFVEGAGITTSAQRYRFRVADAEYGVQTFRLRQVDTDGTTALSAVQPVRLVPEAAVPCRPIRTRLARGSPRASP